MKKIVISIILFLTAFNYTIAQIKYEKEYKLNQEQVPRIALDFVDKLGFEKKVKWYKEEAIDKTSIEAKTKHFSKKYSVEFNSDGEIEDIEIKIESEEVPTEVYQSILQYLNTNYQKVKICKIQLQLSGESNALIQTINNQDFKDNSNITTRYEIVLNAKESREYQKLEYLFNHQGDMLRKAVILLKNTDNLEY